MLTAEQIGVLRDSAEKLLDPITEYLLDDIAKRVAAAGQFTGTASYQVWRLQELGLSQRQIKKEVAKRLKISLKETEKLLTQVAKTGYNFDMSRFPTKHGIPFSANSSLQQILQATVQLAKEDLTNITQTIGFVGPDGKCRKLTDAYNQACDFAFQKASTGAQDYWSAIREATKNLADQGIRVIDYESGVHTSLEAAVRRNIMGGAGLMQEQISQLNHDELGCDGWEISAHAASAPDHEPIQGRQYTDAEYYSLNNSLVRRIGTLNCGHSAFPIILGVNDPQYTAEELEQFRKENEEGITIGGKHYTLYEATQRQRKYERKIRKQRHKLLVAEGLNDKDQLQTAQIKMVRLQEEYVRFSKDAKLPLQHARMEVAGFNWKHAKAAETAVKNASIEQIFKQNEAYRNQNGEFDVDIANKDYANFLTTVPEKNRILLEQSLSSVSYEKRALSSAPFGYSLGLDKVLYDPSRSDFWQLDYAVANTHELAHRIDGFFVQSQDSQAFSAAIANARKILEANPNKFIAYCRQNDGQGFMSDIFSAISGAKYRFQAGHPAEYWANPGNKEREIFANLFSLEAFDDTEKIKFLRDNFPELLEVYDGLVY